MLTNPRAQWSAPFEVYFDGDCPLCLKEIQLLRWMDRNDRIVFTDIAASDFDEEKAGLSYEQLMEEIHGRLPDGTLVVGVEVFRQLYGRVGLRLLIPVSRLPGLSWMLDRLYTFFARYRLRLTGRCADGQCVRPTDTLRS